MRFRAREELIQVDHDGWPWKWVTEASLRGFIVAPLQLRQNDAQAR
jgi:hypothetical protein